MASFNDDLDVDESFFVEGDNVCIFADLSLTWRGRDGEMEGCTHQPQHEL